MEAKKAYVEYTGAGDFIPGVPARDLTLKDWQNLNEDQRAAAAASGLYIIPPVNRDELKGKGE